MIRALSIVLLIAAAVTAAAAERSVEVEVVIDAPVSEVWKSWTTKEGLTSFFAQDARLDLRPGGAYEILFANGIGCNGCTVMAVQPEKLLAFTWNSPPHLAEVRPHFTHVTLRFEAAGPSATRLRLREDGWGEGGQWDESYEYFSKAWPRVLRRLRERYLPAVKDNDAF